MRDSFENKSRLQSKIFLNDKYEKSSLFKIAQNNFRKNNSEDDFSENSDTYENIFSDGEISVKNSKNNGFFTPTTSNIINLNLKSEKE